jgi:DNA-binding NarL/FixJ family response regulator
VVTLDGGWHVAHLSTDEQLLGNYRAELIDKWIIDLIHLDDVAALLWAFAVATADTHAAVHIRFRHRDETWRTVRVVVTSQHVDGSTRFVLTLTPTREQRLPSSRTRVSELAKSLRRIAAEVEASGAVSLGSSVAVLDLPAIDELSVREWEVVSRLVRGERVPGIAREMYLSQSTIRNHLSAVFRKVGVHSQQELLTLLRGA